MKRFLIFLALFPVVATAAFYAVTYAITGLLAQDSGAGIALIYGLFIVPGLLVALLDWLVAKSPVPAVIITTLLTYGATVLTMALLLGSSRHVVALGLIGAIPAALCSLLSSRSDAAAQASSPA
ncbi:hypothetical protein [Tardiphaga sp. 768_D3_N2_1]|uniref:hypothetical protein n=1 Tax=Tardiphaga sp. 768_D3_N2_1 TaxID=3240783 RepID=UPI003F8A0F34